MARFLAVAIITSGALAVANFVWFMIAEGESMRSLAYSLFGTGVFFVISLPFVLVAGVLFGIPARLLLLKMGGTNLPAFLVGGSLAGLAAGILLIATVLSSFAAFIPSAIYGAFGGFTAALAWWPLVEHREKSVINA